MYVAKFDEATYVLHCIRRKTQATDKQDNAIAEVCFRAVFNAERGKTWP